MKLIEYKKIAPLINREIEAVLLKHGFKMGKLGASIEESAGTIRLTINASDMNLKDDDGNTTTGEAERYKKNCHLLYPAIDLRWLDQEFTSQRRTFKLAGMLNTRSPKCLLATSVPDGKRYVFTAEGIASIFALKDKLASLQKKTA